MDKVLSCQEAVSLLEDYFLGTTQSALSDRYGISEKAVYNILYLITYKECTREYVYTHGGTSSYLIELAKRKQRGLGRVK
jgi:hypothetical protein